MKRRLYLLHRRLSIIIAVPVLVWASSGIMHPLMTNIRPALSMQVYPAEVLPVSKHWLPLDTVLRRRHLDSISAVRLVHIDTNWFYQVARAPGLPVYLSCTNGKLLPMGDWLYAQWLARYFLEGRGSGAASGSGEDDCCGAATACVLHPSKGAVVSSVSLISRFDDEYKSVNRLLPVYRVDFQRADRIRVYVETTQDRFAFAMDRRRAVFDEVFRYCHLWGWLDWLGKGRIVVEGLVASTAFVTAVLGIWIFFATRRKTKGLRRLHRWTAIAASLFTLFWSFSGAYHAFFKWVGPADPGTAPIYIAAVGVSPDWERLTQVVIEPIANFSVVRMEDKVYWRICGKDGGICYVGVKDYTVLPNGDREYARWLAARICPGPREATRVTAFNEEYNFSFKRLPVWRVTMAGPGHDRLFVETGSGALAARVNDAVYSEGWSFAIFHKHHFMDWGGKSWRDGSTVFGAFLQLVLVGVGLLFFFRKKPGNR